MRGHAVALLIVVAIAVSACGRGFLRQYEYEEEVYLDVDGSATVSVTASLLALRVLRGLDVADDPRGRPDRQRLRRAFDSNVARVTRVSRLWRRDGRRFAHVVVEVDDIRQLSAAPPFDWSQYSLTHEGNTQTFRQFVRGRTVSDAAAQRVWDGTERVAFRLHLPSRVQYHNVRDLDTDEPGGVDRGNILTWEQRLGDRLAGKPLEMEVRMDRQSILHRTLWLFGGAFGAAILTLGAIVWWTARRGRHR
jgi:hypothetical protein